MGCGLQCTLGTGVLLSHCSACFLGELSAFFHRVDVDVEAPLIFILSCVVVVWSSN